MPIKSLFTQRTIMMNNMLGNQLSAEGSFTIGIDKSSGRGTKIILYIKEDQNEYLEESKIKKKKNVKVKYRVKMRNLARLTTEEHN